MTEDLEQLPSHLDASFAELHRHLDVSTESLKQEIRLVGEAVAKLGKRMDRRHEDFREEMRRGFKETQAAIGFSQVRPMAGADAGAIIRRRAN